MSNGIVLPNGAAVIQNVSIRHNFANLQQQQAIIGETPQGPIVMVFGVTWIDDAVLKLCCARPELTAREAAELAVEILDESKAIQQRESERRMAQAKATVNSARPK